MSYDGKITTYLQTGSGAPSGAPNVPSGSLVLYYDETGDALYAYNWTATAWQAAGGGGSGFAAPTIRGSGMQASSASSFTVNWPSGTIDGDLAIIFGGGGYNLGSTPSGWTLLDSEDSSQCGFVIAKVLNSTDITAGGVTLTMGGTYDATIGIITFEGATSGIISLARTNASGAASEVVNLPAYFPSLMGVYFGSVRGNGTATCNQGSELQQATSAGDENYGCLYAGTPSGLAPFGTTFSYTSAGTANYQVALLVEGP